AGAQRPRREREDEAGQTDKSEAGSRREPHGRGRVGGVPSSTVPPRQMQIGMRRPGAPALPVGLPPTLKSSCRPAPATLLLPYPLLMSAPGYQSPFSSRPGLREEAPAFQRVSIVVPFYNEAECAEAVLRELRACQPEAEIVAVDAGSTDRTWEILRSIPGISPLRLTENRGQSGALFAGLRYAPGDLLVM